MYRVLLERAAEKDLKQLSAKLHDRVIAAMQALATNPRPARCRKLETTAMPGPNKNARRLFRRALFAAT